MTKSSTADLILENANVITCDPQKPKAEAVAVKDDRILRVGSNRELKENKAEHTRMIDCERKTLIPGFNDAHCHFFSSVRKLFSLDLSPAKVHSIEDIKEAIRHKVRFTPEEMWIRGTDYNEFYLKEKRHPTRRDLDEAAPNHPVILTHRSLHASVLNSPAMKIVGITGETEEPPGGMIERDLETGEPNGILYEMQEYIQSRTVSSISEVEMEWGIAETNRQYLSMGITSFGEASVTNDLEQWQTYRKLKASGKIQSRIYMMAGSGFANEFRKTGLNTGEGDNDLKVGGLKIILSQATGKLQPSQEELNQIVLDALRLKNFQVALHAVERDTVEAAVIALEFAQSRLSQADRRPRIEHCSECPPELIQRLRRLKAVIVSQPPFVYYHGERYLAQIPEETQKWLYPFKSWIDSGLVTAGSSDSPVVPNNPLMGIYAAVTRRADEGFQYTDNSSQTQTKTVQGKKVLPAEAISARRALEMYTINGAYASFEEESKGSLTPGKLADIVMLSADPLRSLPEKIKDIRVEMTVIGGKVMPLATGCQSG